MSLEARIELLTAAVIELTAAIGAMQAPGPAASLDVYKEATKDRSGGQKVREAEAAIVAAEVASAKKDDQPKSTDTTSGQQSAPTGESSLQEQTPLDYAKDVKPITIRLSKEKGREITIGVLSRFGVKSAQDLDAGQWADYIAHCEKVLVGGEV